MSHIEYICSLIEAEQETCTDLSDHVVLIPGKHCSSIEAAGLEKTYGVRVIRT